MSSGGSLACALGVVLGALLSSSLVTAEARRTPLAIAPLEADLQSMREVLQQLEEVVNARQPEQVEGLISPRANDDQREAILAAVEHLCQAMTPDSRYHLRTDLGRDALVPVGLGRVQIQVRGVRVDGEERFRGSVQLHLEPVESGGRRRWLLTSLDLPGQRFRLPRGQRWLPLVAAALGVVLVAVAVVIVLARRRRHVKGAPL